MATLTGGSGTAFEFPVQRSQAEEAVVNTPSGPVPLCATVAAAVASAFPTVAFEPATADVDYKVQFGDLHLQHINGCTFTPNDRDLRLPVSIVLIGPDSGGALEQFTSDKGDRPSSGGLGDDSVVSYGSVGVMKDGYYLRVYASSGNASSSEEASAPAVAIANTVLGLL